VCSDHGVLDLVIEETSLPGLCAEVVAEICELKSAIWRELAPSDPLMTPDAALSELLSAPAQTTERLVVAKLAGKVAGIGISHRPTSSVNANLLTVTVEVHPSHRRCGLGRLLLAALVSAGREAGCDSILGWGPRTEATNNFWEAFGVPEVQRSSRSRAIIATIDVDLMASWEAASAARSAGYHLRSFVGACPDQYMDLYTTALNGMQDAPSDGLDQSYEPLDKVGVRSYEARLAERGGTGHVILAVDSAGNAAGITEVATFDHTPRVVFQQTTAILPAHRRQGLGRWLKAEMYRHIIDWLPDADVIETGNADSNEPMLAVNAEMGFAPFLSYTIRQGDMAAVAQRLEVVQHH
jgi:mycothiol synthase